MEIWDFIQDEILGMRWMNRLIGVILDACGLDTSGRLGGSIQFFIYDVIKIMLLLGVLIFVISYIQMRNRVLQRTVIVLTVCRIFLCLLPGNRWMTNDGTMLWAVLRNVPFIIIGILAVIAFYRSRNDTVHFKNMWIYIILSFAFYIPVAVGAGIVPMLGMLMLPKTICVIY